MGGILLAFQSAFSFFHRMRDAVLYVRSLTWSSFLISLIWNHRCMASADRICRRGGVAEVRPCIADWAVEANAWKKVLSSCKSYARYCSYVDRAIAHRCRK
jgi:hypothetical protein